MKRRFPPYSRKLSLGRQQPNHVFVLTGPGAFDHAARLYKLGQCQPAIPSPENITPSLYEWPVCGMDVTVKDFGASIEHAETLCYELLAAGANLVVYVDSADGQISVHRPKDTQNVA